MAHDEAHNWREGLSLLQRIKYMMDGQYGSDVTLVVGQGSNQETIRAHKFILIAGSPYFENLLLHKSVADDVPVVLSDVQPDVMKHIVKYLYSEEIDMNPANVLDVLITSKKFEIPQLAQLCSLFLEKILKAKNVCAILSQSISYNETQLVDKCMGLIAAQANEVLASTGFSRMSQAALLRVVESDMLCGVKEKDVYDACMKWANQKCRDSGREFTDKNRRDVLGTALFQIRFPSMDNMEFADLTSDSTLLTDQEKLSVYAFISLKQMGKSSQSTMQFNVRGRDEVATHCAQGRTECELSSLIDPDESEYDYDPYAEYIHQEDDFIGQEDDCIGSEDDEDRY